MLFSLGARAFCQRFDLTNTKQRVKVRNEIFPTMIANREAILAAPDNLEQILDEHKRRVAQQARDASDDVRFAQAREKRDQGKRKSLCTARGSGL